MSTVEYTTEQKLQNSVVTAVPTSVASIPQVKKQGEIVAIDDDPMTLVALESHVGNMGLEIKTAKTGCAGLELIGPDTAIAMVDLRLPDLGGMDCLRYIRKHHPQIQVIILTASAEIDDAVQAMKDGAFQYITKPFDHDQLQVHLLRALDAWDTKTENSSLKESLSISQPATLPPSYTECSDELLKSIRRMSQLDATVFIRGESGTGKSTIARMIHQLGHRSGSPFVSINCASLPRDVIESELFGHARGAFNGALNDRPGRAEVADGGTLFLDEIGDLPLELQPKLLTFLQDRMVQRMGSNEQKRVDVRLIVATHRDLSEMCQQHRFRQDLFYRLNVLSLALPPLRERDDEISAIANSVLGRICQRQKLRTPRLTDAALQTLTQYPWPGNIRELENVLERAVAFCDSDLLDNKDLLFDGPFSLANSSASSTGVNLAGKTLEEIERMAIEATLESCKGNKAKTARILGISEKSIYNKIRRLNITDHIPATSSE